MRSSAQLLFNERDSEPSCAAAESRSARALVRAPVMPAAKHAGPVRRNASTPGAACGMLSKSKAAAPKGADAAADASAGAPAPGATPPARRMLPLHTMETATRCAALCPRTGASKQVQHLAVCARRYHWTLQAGCGLVRFRDTSHRMGRQHLWRGWLLRRLSAGKGCLPSEVLAGYGASSAEDAVLSTSALK